MLPEKLANVLIDPIAQLMVEYNQPKLCILWSGAQSTSVGTKAGSCLNFPVYRLDKVIKGCRLVLEVRNDQHFVVRRMGYNGETWEELTVGTQV